MGLLRHKKSENTAAHGDETQRCSALVLVEKKKGVWVAYSDHILRMTGSGIWLMSASEICAALELELVNEGKQWSIKKTDLRLNRYIPGKSEYTYVLNSKETKKNAAFAAVPSADGKELFIAPNSLRTLCYFQSFEGGRIRNSAYSRYGYEIVYTFSLIGVVQNCPTIGSVLTEAGEPYEKKLVHDRRPKAWIVYSKRSMPEPEQEPKQELKQEQEQGTEQEPEQKQEERPKIAQPEYFTLFGGRRIRRSHAFREPGPDIYWAEDKDLLFLEKEGMKEYVESGCGVLLINSTVYFNTSGDYRTPCIKLTIEDDAYYLRLYSGLWYTKAEKRLGKRDYTEVKQGILRLLLYKISSTPEQLFHDIYETEQNPPEEDSNEPQYGGDCVWYRIKEEKCVAYRIAKS